ncbi:MAG: non-canonical purine NTP pyrophosphatase [Deltaproteobacteria bacterium CG11_big_fil_rev_8_21_14_0_20_47_16]|nr:MAG: non-canonical purine NTP pyrophosphatase [Deltaproteobacteria bacterium CG11_big_fil_rev_8_21_14_0_20_47_16]
MEIVIATHNQGKMAEFERLMKGWPVHLRSLREFDSVKLPPEDGESFKDNALIKARAVCSILGMPALADDSGLVVHSLNDEPGIYSARYAGPNATSAENITKLLEKVHGKSDKDRLASFFCVMALVCPDGREWIRTGQCDGLITSAPSGDKGFGYDPVFLIPEYHLTMAQLSPEFKDAISHRGKAVRDIQSVIVDLAREKVQ